MAKTEVAALLPAIVVALYAKYMLVEIDDHDGTEFVDFIALANNKYPQFLCTRRRRLDHIGATVNVGDFVWIEAVDWENKRAVVNNVLSRKSWMQRPSIANFSEVVVAISLTDPRFDIDQVSRFLLTAEQTGVNVRLILTKRDLVTLDDLEKQLVRLSFWGYHPLAVSVETGEGLEELQQELSRSSLSVICGPSGVGKSSLLNWLLGSNSLPVGPLSGRLRRGRHTTRHVELFKLCLGSRVADTPGFNRPKIHVDPINVAFLFPELRDQLAGQKCRFRDCLHLDEPGCVIKKGWERYPFYRTCLEEMIAFNRSYQGD